MSGAPDGAGIVCCASGKNVSHSAPNRGSCVGQVYSTWCWYIARCAVYKGTKGFNKAMPREHQQATKQNAHVSTCFPVSGVQLADMAKGYHASALAVWVVPKG